ncbi:hypothetical protein SAMN05444162_1601 [Paenibacillaceae bacterium GAS479]|nr:hypothetical protein SAMN05444162_1601 [Paenibacillaceae bacterium GAS479]
MKYECVETSHLKGSSKGMILVLFILLVIVTCAVNTENTVRIPPPDDGSSSITSTRSFDIINETRNTTFDRISISGYVARPYPMRMIPPGGQVRFDVTSYTFVRTTGTVNYIGLQNNNQTYVGGLTFTMVSLGGISVSFTNVGTNGPFYTSTEFPLFAPPQLIIVDL